MDKKRRRVKMSSDFVTTRCPAIANMPQHGMAALPLYAIRGRGSGFLWVEVAEENIGYLTSAFDEWADSLPTAKGETSKSKDQQDTSKDC